MKRYLIILAAIALLCSEANAHGFGRGFGVRGGYVGRGVGFNRGVGYGVGTRFRGTGFGYGGFNNGVRFRGFDGFGRPVFF